MSTVFENNLHDVSQSLVDVAMGRTSAHISTIFPESSEDITVSSASNLPEATTSPLSPLQDAVKRITIGSISFSFMILCRLLVMGVL